MSAFEIDEAAILKAYHLDSLEPTAWHMSELDNDDKGNASSTAVADEPDPLGLRPSMTQFRSLDKETKTHISLSSKAFDPKIFLNSVHPDATFANLSHGILHLKQSINQRSEALKVLVEENFDRFVAVKATNDGVYREMKDGQGGPLGHDADYGVKGLNNILAQASAKADHVFMPVLENNLKTIKLRSTLGVFEKSKFFFNLPGSLYDSVEAGRYDVALRDYKKGKYLLDSRPGQLLNLSSGQTSASDPNMAAAPSKQHAQQRRVFAKVWDAVEATMKDMQSRLIAQLREPRRNIDEQEKTIEILLELDPDDDPVTIYLDSLHNHIRSLMRKAFDTNIAKIQAIGGMSDLVTRNERDRARDIQKCVHLLTRGDSSFDKTKGSDSWKAIHELVRSVSDTIVTTLPNFWRVAKSHMEGKFTKGKMERSAANERIFAQFKAWASEALDAYVSLLSHFFTLTDVSILARQPLSPLPDWVPKDTCSATAAHYLRLSLTELVETVSDLASLGISKNNSLKSLLANARFRFTEILCFLWQEDAKIFYLLEDWTLNPDEQATTLHLKDMAAFHKSNARQAYHIAGGREKDSLDSAGGGSSKSNNRDHGVPAEFTGRIKTAFLDALYAFLDGLIQLAFSEYDPLDPTMVVSQKVIGDSKLTVDVRDLDTRILLSVTNLSHLSHTIVPNLIKQFQEAYHVKMNDDLKTLEEVAQQLDSILFSDFQKRKSDAISKIIRDGILSSGINWQTIPKPSGVHPFIYEALLSLVQVHAQVRAITKPLVSRTILSLVEDLARITLESFQKISRFGMGGMLQATLEIEFMHQTLSQYISTEAEVTLKQVYETISIKYKREAASSGMIEETEQLKLELEEVKQTLIASRKATALEFLCFRKSRSLKEREGILPRKEEE